MSEDRDRVDEAAGVDALRERPSGCRVGPIGRHTYEFALWPSQRRQPAAEDAAGVDADGVVDPDGVAFWGVAIHERSVAAVIGRPAEPHRQTEFIRLPVGLAVQGEAADCL